MEDTAILSILGDIDLVAMCVTGSDVMAASDKGYREFNKNGVPYRATDYDSRQKRRVPVPIRDSQQVVPPMSPEVKELVNLPVPLQKQASQYAIQGLAIAAKSLDGEFASEDAKKGFFDNARAIIKQLKENPSQFFKTMWENTQPLREKLKTHWDNNSDLYIGGALLAGGIGLLTGAVLSLGAMATFSGIADRFLLGKVATLPEFQKALATIGGRIGMFIARAAVFKLEFSAIIALVQKAIFENTASLSRLYDRMFRSKEIVGDPLGVDAPRVKKAMEKVGIDYTQLSERLGEKGFEGIPDKGRELALEKEELELKKQLQKELKSLKQPTKDGLLHFRSADDQKYFEGEPFPTDVHTQKVVDISERLNAIKGEIYQAKGYGYSLRKRVMELTQLIEDGNKDSEEIRWRKMVVESEIKYGKQLDALAESTDQSTLLGSHKQLLDALTKNPPKAGEFSPMSEADSIALSKYNLGTAPLSKKEAKDNIVARGIEDAGELQKLINTPLNVSYGVFHFRAHAMPGEKAKDKGMLHCFDQLSLSQFQALNAFKEHDGIVNLGDCIERNEDDSAFMGYEKLASPRQTIKAMAFHETGHILEMKLGLSETSAAFRHERARETPAVYQRTSVGLPLGAEKDHFFDPYVGVAYKFGRLNYATEVVSSGIEALSNPRLTKYVASADRENLLYAMGVMDFEPSKN